MLCMAMAVGTVANARSLEIDVYGPGQNSINLIQAKPLISPEAKHSPQAVQDSAKLNKLITDNLFYLPFMNLVADNSILGGNTLTGASSKQIDFKKYQLANVDLLITEFWPAVPEGARPKFGFLDVFFSNWRQSFSDSGKHVWTVWTVFLADRARGKL